MGRRASPEALEAALARRVARATRATVRTEWFINKVLRGVAVSSVKRIRIATEFLRSRVVLNISQPVTKSYTTRTSEKKVRGKSVTKTRSTVRVTDRSSPGEFPKADMTLLIKSIFGIVDDSNIDIPVGYVGTPVDYGLFLEMYMDRSFLNRTLEENKQTILKILTGPVQ